MRGALILLLYVLIASAEDKKSIYLIINLIEDRATAEFVWASLLETLSIIFSAYWGSLGRYAVRVSRIYTTPHSLQSFIAVSSFETRFSVSLRSGSPLS